MTVTPMTPEQMAWVAEQVENAARKASRRTRNQGLVAFLVLLAALGYVNWDGDNKADNARKAVVDSGTVISVDGCNRDFNSRVELRTLLSESRKATVAAFKKGQISEDQYKDALKFYDERLAKLPLPDCRKAKNILTSDPDRVPPVPAPLHP